MTPPDSDAREVKCAICARRDAPTIRLPLPLARRILAALEEPTGQGRRRGAIADGILAAELRERIGK